MNATMKGLLIHLGVTPTKTHDLAFLGQSIAFAIPAWSWPQEDLRFLTRAPVAFRYPGESAEPEEAAEAFAIASRLRKNLMELLGEQNNK